MKLFLEGILFGFLIAVPVGPIGLLCINRALSGGAAYGLVSGLGIATADAIAGFYPRRGKALSLV
jgi:threonine/homoserine/homoserine lactone efflux protein